MGHADLIDIREAHAEPDITRGRILHHHIHFAAGIARRLLHGKQYVIRKKRFSHTFGFLSG